MRERSNVDTERVAPNPLTGLVGWAGVVGQVVAARGPRGPMDPPGGHFLIPGFFFIWQLLVCPVAHRGNYNPPRQTKFATTTGTWKL